MVKQNNYFSLNYDDITSREKAHCSLYWIKLVFCSPQLFSMTPLTQILKDGQ